MKACKKLLCMILTITIISSLLVTGIVSAKAVEEPVVKNVILMIGDGMGAEQVKAGHIYLGENLVFENFEHTTMVSTGSVSGVTDSAAAATAMASGVKTTNSHIGLDKDGKKIENLVEFSKARGLKTGIVATQVLPHATPAGFTAHVTSRYSYNTIAVQQILLQPDVLMGGGATYFTNRTSLLESNNFALVTTIEEAKSVSEDKNLLGVFDNNYISADESPKLSEMTELALERLSSDEGFFVMIEGSDIDSYCHQNDMENMLKELLVFNDAVKKAKEYVDNNPDTLLIVTADHETGNLEVFDDALKSDLQDSLFSSQSHTGVDVPLYAYGAGANELCLTQRIDNTDIYKFIASKIEAQYGSAEPTDFTNYNDYRLFFKKPESWSNVSAYLTETDYTEAVIYGTEYMGDDIYCLTLYDHDTIDTDKLKISFANSADCSISTGYQPFEGYYKLYDMELSCWVDYVPVQGVVYFEAPENWSEEVYVYTTGSCYYGAEPGTKMTKVDGSDNVFSLKVSDDVMVENFLEFTLKFTDVANNYKTLESNFAGFNKIYKVFGGANTTSAFGCWYDYPYEAPSATDDEITIYLVDETEWNIKSANADLLVQCDGANEILMEYQGKDNSNAKIWSAVVPANSEGIIFIRRNNSGDKEVWNVFAPTQNRGENTLYAITDDNGGYWSSAREIIPDDELEVTDTAVTIYYAVPQAIAEAGFTVKVNNRWDNDSGEQKWSQYNMTKTENTYNGKPVYTASYVLTYGHVYVMQLQNYDKNVWKSQTVVINEEWTSAQEFNGKLYDGTKWVDYVPGTDVGSGETVKIYFDATPFNWYTGAAFKAYDEDMQVLVEAESLAQCPIPEGYTPSGSYNTMFYTGYIPANAKYIEFFRIDNGNVYNYCCTADDIENTVMEITGDTFVLDGVKVTTGYRSGNWINISQQGKPSYVIGDADMSGVVNIKDATTIQKHLAKMTELESVALLASDVNVDLTVNIKDATIIQKHIAKMDIDYPVGEAA